MNDAFHAASSSMMTVMRLLDLASQNAASSQLPGYKPQVLATRSFVTQLDRELGREAALVRSEGATNFTQGPLVPSENPHAAALRGPGFFAVETPGGVRYTRNGDFQVGTDGALATRAGYPVLGEAGPLRGLPGPEPVRIAEGGRVMQGEVEIGRLLVTEFDRKVALVREGDAIFAAPPEAAAKPAGSTTVAARMLELPPESTAEAMVSLIAASHSFQHSQKVLTALSESYERLLRQ